MSISGSIVAVTCIFMAVGVASTEAWMFHGVGNVQYSHFYVSEDQKVRRVCVASEEGVVALLDSENGNVVWRDYPETGRKIDQFIARDQYVIVFSQNHRRAEVFNLRLGQMVNSVLFDDTNYGGCSFSDGFFSGARSGGGVKYTLMGSEMVATYVNHSAVLTLNATENEVFMHVFQDPVLDVPIIVSIFTKSPVARIWFANNAFEPLTFPFNRSVDSMYKLRKHMVVYRPAKDANSDPSFLIYNTETHRLSTYDLGAGILRGFHIEKTLAPRNLVVLRNWREHSLLTFREGLPSKVVSFPLSSTEYSFGTEEDSETFYVCESNNTGYRLFSMTPNGSTNYLYENGNELNRRLYGEPEMIWAKKEDGLILLKTSDGSLHLIRNGERKWTKPFGLSHVIKAVPHQNSVIVLSNSSKLISLGADAGNIKWERSAIGRISDFYETRNGSNLALVIDSTDVHKTRIAEVQTVSGGKTEFYEAYNGVFRIHSEEVSSKENRGNTTLMLISDSNTLHVYPNTLENREKIVEHRKDITYYEVNKEGDMIIAYKPNANASSLSQVWNISFSLAKEKIIAWKKGGEALRDKVIVISGKEYRRFDKMGNVLILLTSSQRSKMLNLYLVNVHHGAIYTVLPLYEAEPVNEPIIAVYDSTIFLSFHYVPQYDKLIVIDVCQTTEFSAAGDFDVERKVGIEYNEGDTIFSIKTVLELGWEVFGLQTVGNDTDFSVFILDQFGNVHVVNPTKLDRGRAGTVTEENSWKLEVTGKTLVKRQANMLYHAEKKALLIFGIDVYAFKIQ